MIVVAISAMGCSLLLQSSQKNESGTSRNNASKAQPNSFPEGKQTATNTAKPATMPMTDCGAAPQRRANA